MHSQTQGKLIADVVRYNWSQNLLKTNVVLPTKSFTKSSTVGIINMKYLKYPVPTEGTYNSIVPPAFVCFKASL